MAYDLEVRVNGVIKLGGQIEDIPSFALDGKTAVVTAVFVEDLPVPEVPLINVHDINGALEAEGESPDGADQGAEDVSPETTEQGVDGESSQLDDKPRRKGGRHKGESEPADPPPTPESTATEPAGGDGVKEGEAD